MNGKILHSHPWQSWSLPMRMHEMRSFTASDGDGELAVSVLRVPGGWLYVTPFGQSFVPEMITGFDVMVAEAEKELKNTAQ